MQEREHMAPADADQAKTPMRLLCDGPMTLHLPLPMLPVPVGPPAPPRPTIAEFFRNVVVERGVGVPDQITGDYLKAIWSLGGGAASTKDVADQLSISSASVSNMFVRLQEMGFVEYERYRGVSLTERGREAALRLAGEVNQPIAAPARQLVTRKGVRDGMRRCGPSVWSHSHMAQLSSASSSPWCILTSTFGEQGSTPMVIPVNRCDEWRASAILGRVCAMLAKRRAKHRIVVHRSCSRIHLSNGGMYTAGHTSKPLT
jgi:DNA-binding transcriptional regulator YhcF (GntR family)